MEIIYQFVASVVSSFEFLYSFSSVELEKDFIRKNGSICLFFQYVDNIRQKNLPSVLIICHAT